MNYTSFNLDKKNKFDVFNLATIIFLMRNIVKTWLLRFCQIFSWQRFANFLAGLIVFYLLFSYFAVNPIAKKLIPRLADQSLNSAASVNRVDFDPYRLKVTVHDFKLTNKAENQELVSFKKFIVDFELSGIFDLAWKFKQVAILDPNINLATSPDGIFNWNTLLEKLNEGPEQAPSDTIPSVIVEQFVVSGGNLHYADANRDQPIDMTLAPLSFRLKGFSTVPRDRGDYFISAALSDDGGILRWKGDMGVNPVASTGLIAVEGVKIAETLQLLKGLSLPIDIQNGEAYTSFNYDFSIPKTVPTLKLTDIKLGLTDLAGKLIDGGNLNLKHAGLVVNSLDFVKDTRPEMQLKQLVFKLSDIKVSQAGGSEVLLKDLNATMPQLDFFMQEETPQLYFNDLNVSLVALGLRQGESLNLMVPSSQINAVSLDLLKSSVDFKGIVLSDIRFGKTGNEIDVENGRADKPLATLTSLNVVEGGISLSDKTFGVQSILLDGFKTSVIRKADTTINWVELFNTQELAKTSQSADQSDDQVETNNAIVSTTVEVNEAPIDSIDQEKTTPWTVNLNKLALNNANIHIEDMGAPLPVILDVEEATMELGNISLDMMKPLPVKAAFKVKQGGQFSTKGQLWPSPFKADLGLRLSQLSLKPFSPYMNQYALLKLEAGNASVSGKLNVTQKQATEMAFSGGFNVEQIAVVEEEDDKPFLSWNRLGSDRLNLTLAPNALKIGTLNINQPSAKFIIYEDKTTNLSRILRSNNVSEPSASDNNQAIDQPSTAPTNAFVNDNSLIKGHTPSPTVVEKAKENPRDTQLKTVSTTEASFPISIDAVRLNDAKLVFADLSLTPQFGTNVHSLNGVINGLSTKAEKVAQVEMEGKVDEYGSAKISGSLQPFNVAEFTDIKLAFTNLDMSNLTPYSGKFAGRYIDSGKLSVDLGYKIKQQQLIGENKFIINKLKLGEKVKSDAAADLPLDLAIAILEDSDGVIDLDLPISGSLDNPQFSFASIAWKAFRNVISKIVTAPFRALGKLFGGKGVDFESVSFQAGEKEISPPELEKLMKITEVLKKRQGLSLAIVPSYSVKADTTAIQELQFRTDVVKEMGVKLETGQKPGPIDLENEDVQKAVDALYNDLTNKGLLKRLVSKFEKPEDGHYEKAKTKLIASIEITDQELETLATERGAAIKQVLLDNGLSADRLVLAKPKNVNDKGGKVSTQFELNVDKNLPQAVDNEIKDKQNVHDIDIKSTNEKSTVTSVAE